MHLVPLKRAIRTTLTTGLAITLTACGGGGGDGGGGGSTAQSGNVSLVISDASSDDWATIGVKILSISLTP